jgi:uncharacterized protein involved in outer membrane biogenesis
MEEKTRASTSAGKSWAKRIGIGVGILLVLLIAAYFIGTSSAFLKAVVLPRAGAALNAKITAGNISVSPFSRAHITRLRVETTGDEPLLTAEEVLLRYSLMDIIRGNINVDEVTLNTPVITVVQNADGTSNLDPILKSDKKDEPDKPSSDEPTKLSVKNVSLKNGTVRQIQHGEKGDFAKTELSDINVTLDRLGNDQSGNLKLSSKFSMEQRASGTNSVLAGDISGGYEVALNQDLLPKTVKGSSKVTLSQGTGSFKDLAGLSTSLDADLTPTEIKQAGLKFARNN